MTIKLDETIRGIWYCPVIPGKQDFLMSLSHIADGDYELTYRFRYYNSEDPFDKSDEKNWYRIKVTEKNEEKIINTAREMIQKLISLSNAPNSTELLRGNQSLEEFIAEFMKLEFVHVQKVH